MTAPDRTPADPSAATPTRRRAPFVRWIRALPQGLYAALILAVVVILLLVAMLVNPGERVGPVQPARPPVGGPGVPAARL